MILSAPFPWFGGKRKVADEVWSRFGDVTNYVEPFFGSGAVLLGRPRVTGTETINDLDGYVANFWRATKLDPDAVAEHADNPVNENDLHARHFWLLQQRETLRARLEGDPEFYDAKIAGWWVWGISCWIGSGFCSGRGPWTVRDGMLVRDGAVGPESDEDGNNGQGVNRQLVHIGNNGRGSTDNSCTSGTTGEGTERKRINLPQGGGRGVTRQLPSTNMGATIYAGARLVPWFRALSDRLSRVRVCSGDWSRVCGPSVTFKHGATAVFLDPPYADTAERASDLYRVDDEQVAHAAREWAIENGKRPDMRIALCGYEGEHTMPGDWAVQEWSAGAGFGGQAEERSGNGKRERIWYSPACLSAKQGSLFGAAVAK